MFSLNPRIINFSPITGFGTCTTISGLSGSPQLEYLKFASLGNTVHAFYSCNSQGLTCSTGAYKFSKGTFASWTSISDTPPVYIQPDPTIMNDMVYFVGGTGFTDLTMRYLNLSIVYLLFCLILFSFFNSH